MTFLRRVWLTLFRRRRIIADLEPGEIFSVLEDVKARHPEVYGEDAMPPETARRLSDWQDREQRKSMIAADMLRRREEGRVRRPIK